MLGSWLFNWDWTGEEPPPVSESAIEIVVIRESPLAGAGSRRTSTPYYALDDEYWDIRAISMARFLPKKRKKRFRTR